VMFNFVSAWHHMCHWWEIMTISDLPSNWHARGQVGPASRRYPPLVLPAVPWSTWADSGIRGLQVIFVILGLGHERNTGKQITTTGFIVGSQLFFGHVGNVWLFVLMWFLFLLRFNDSSTSQNCEAIHAAYGGLSAFERQYVFGRPFQNLSRLKIEYSRQ
jgi:hypothetical protein